MATAVARTRRPCRLAFDPGRVVTDVVAVRTGGTDRDLALSELIHRTDATAGADHGYLDSHRNLIAIGLPITTVGIAFAAVGITFTITADWFTQPVSYWGRLPHTEFEAVTRPQLIATDLDGTFLRPDSSVSPTNAAAVARAAQLGVPFVIATGRPTRWLGVLDGLDAAHRQVIVSNGGAVVDLASRRVLTEFGLGTAVALDVAAALRRAIPGITFGLETGSGFGCEPTSPSRQRDEPGHQIGELEELAAVLGPVIKVLGFHREINSEDLTNLASEIVGDRLNLTHASVSQSYGMIELTAPGVSKATTLQRLCTELGIDAADVAAFGDMPNDRDMLAWAGQGFVVANGHHSMLADFEVVPSNAEDGVGRTILELLG